MLISCLCGYLPPAFSMSFIIDATGGLSRWRLVQSLPLRDRAASNQGPGHSTVLTGSSLHGGPQCAEPSNNARTATSVAPGTPSMCQPDTLRMVVWRC